MMYVFNDGEPVLEQKDVARIAMYDQSGNQICLFTGYGPICADSVVVNLDCGEGAQLDCTIDEPYSTWDSVYHDAVKVMIYLQPCKEEYLGNLCSVRIEKSYNRIEGVWYPGETKVILPGKEDTDSLAEGEE